MLSTVGETELEVGCSFGKLWLLFKKYLVAFDSLLPADLVKALSKEYNVGENRLVENLVGAPGSAV